MPTRIFTVREWPGVTRYKILRHKGGLYAIMERDFASANYRRWRHGYYASRQTAEAALHNIYPTGVWSTE